MPKKNVSDYVIVKEFLKSVAGDYAPELVRICENKRDGASDEYIGKKIPPLKITEIRAVLNRLHYQGIATYTKTKDSKSGWYYYSWNIKKDRIVELLMESQNEKLEKLKNKQFMSQNYDYFSCNSACEEIPFEVAAEYKFKCPRCGKSMDVMDNAKRLKTINKNLLKIETELNELRGVGKTQ